MIEFYDVNKIYCRNKQTVQALQSVNLHIQKGEIFGVIGYSGAGKSTLIRMVNALEQPSSGEIIVNGENLSTCSTSELRKVKQKIGMIFQGFNLLESKTVFDNVAIPLVLQKTNKNDIHKLVHEMLAFVGLESKALSFPGQLSGGQKQRVGIARALVTNPSILLCDEATSALDPQTTLSILDLLKRINEQYNITIVLITHEMSVIQHICDRVAVIENGKIVEQGDVLDIFREPKQLITKRFVRSVLDDILPSGIVEKLCSTGLEHLYRLEFWENSAVEPVINSLILKDLVTVNILFAHMAEVKKTVVGSMFVQLKGKPQAINDALMFLKERNVRVKEINPNDDKPIN